MALKIRSWFSPLAATDNDDARDIAAALNHLGYWQPDSKTGIVPFNPDYRFFDALRKFQWKNSAGNDPLPKNRTC